jgi:2-hydroxy-3-keto-5-methylthiopentenyl-1-phosphate phosphatase
MHMAPTYPVGIFCDFDGTISKSDLIASIGREFGGQAGADIVGKVRSGELTVRAGVKAMFQCIPSSLLPQIVEYTRSKTDVRPGFDELVRGCQERGWLFAVVSGGLDFFVQPVVAPYRDFIHVFCNHLDASDEYLSIQWMVPCDAFCEGGCGLCKPTVLRRFQPTTDLQVVVGDGVTDFKAAMKADVVFARDSLKDVCEQREIAYFPFDTLHDILPVLDRMKTSAPDVQQS